jgi:hypothetical protein
LGEDSMQDIEAALADRHYLEVCVNDDPSGLNFEEEQKRLRDAFDRCHPVPCGFEKQGI